MALKAHLARGGRAARLSDAARPGDGPRPAAARMWGEPGPGGGVGVMKGHSCPTGTRPAREHAARRARPPMPMRCHAATAKW